jgi:hypothetical protein
MPPTSGLARIRHIGIVVYLDLTLLSSPARKTSLNGLPASPKRSRIFFSR